MRKSKISYQKFSVFAFLSHILRFCPTRKFLKEKPVRTHEPGSQNILFMKGCSETEKPAAVKMEK